MEGENTAAQEDMQGLGTRDSTADRRADTLEGTRREQGDEEDGEEGAPDGAAQKTTMAAGRRQNPDSRTMQHRRTPSATTVVKLGKQKV